MSFLIFLLSLSAALGKSEVWKTLESENFLIHYDAEQRPLAEHYLRSAERVHSELVLDFKEYPQKTEMVLKDQTDLSNGAATVFPRPTMFLFPAMPELYQSISNDGDWAYLLLKHEYVHILNMNPSHGYAKILRYIFGAWAKPNMFLPSWYKEGIAVERESEEGKFGRLNSEIFHGWLRASVLEGAFTKESIDRINSFAVPEYPYGQRPYYFGALVWQHLVDDYGDEIMAGLNQRYAGRIPWFIEKPLIELTGRSYEAIFSEMLNKKYQQVKEETKDIPDFEDKFSLNLNGYEQRGMKVKGKKILYFAKNKKGLTTLRMADLIDAESFTIKNDQEIDSAQKMTNAIFVDDGILYDKINPFERRKTFSDIFFYSFTTKKSEQKTSGERARYAVQSPNREIFYIQSHMGKQNIIRASSDFEIKERLISGSIGDSFHSLTYFDGKIFFLRQSAKGFHSIESMNLNGKDLRIAFKTENNLYSLNRCGDSLCISLAKDNFSNLYLLKDEKLSALTRTKTFVYEGDLIKDKIIFSEMTKDGLHYFGKKKEDFAFTKVESNKKEELLEEKDKVAKDLIKEEGTYSSTSYLLPKYWFPYYSYDENGSYLQINTGGTDPVGLQSYNLTLSYYTASEEWDQSFFYLNKYWEIPIFLQIFRENDYIEAIDDTLEERQAVLGIQSYLYNLSNDWTWTFQFLYEESELNLNNQAEAGGASFSVEYNGIDRKNHGWHMPAGGNYLKLEHSEFFQNEDWYEFRISEVRYKNHFSKWLPDEHVITNNLLARYSDDEGRPLSLGSISIGGPLNAPTHSSFYTLKGYPSSNFIATSAANWKVSYTFPIREIYKGERTLPYFLKELYANILYEGLVFDGVYYDQENQLQIEEHKKLYSSFGIELGLSTEIFYLAPVNFVFGIYYGENEEAGGSTTSILSLEAPVFP